jgi:elongation factor P
MLTYTELKKGLMIVFENQPYEIIESDFLRMQQRKAVVQIKIKNIINGKILDRNIHASENFEEADVNKKEVKFLYNHRDEFWFCDINNPSNRFSLSSDGIGSQAQFLKNNTVVTAIEYNGKIVNITLPIKMDLKVKETPPGEKGDTATGGKKLAELETGAKVNVPLFVNNDDIVRVNTQTGEYVERVEKA